MSKKQKCKKTTKETYDFSKLLEYCDEEEKGRFCNNLSSHSVSSLIRNPDALSEEELLTVFPNLVRDKEDGLLYRFDKEEDAIGRTLEHFLGDFYILDPSSAAISFYLAPYLRKNFLSLDLCAAPGGKSIALDMRRKDGLYLCNDISWDRALEISKNAQRMHLDNILVMSIDPLKIEKKEIFDLIIADVPCSGSGMIRKDKKMALDYSDEKMERLLPIQKNIFEKAYSLVRKGGIIAYSTCSLSMKEDEEQVALFLKNHPDCSLLSLEMKTGMVKGKDGYGIHMVPGIYDGEGIYFALIRKEGESDVVLTPYRKAIESVHADCLELPYKGNSYFVSRFYEEISDFPYLAPGLKIKDDTEHPKCEYDHSYCKLCKDLPVIGLDRSQALSFIQGNELRFKDEADGGLVVLAYGNRRIGLGKKNQGKIKNYLPKGLRGHLS